MFVFMACAVVAACAGPPKSLNNYDGPNAANSLPPLPWDLDPPCLDVPHPIGTDSESPDSHEPTRSDVIAACGKDRHARNGDFIALTISGGGAKAATFGGEAMFYLDAAGLLKKVDVISSVSGGSFPASYYALSCNPDDVPCQTELHQGLRRPLWKYDDAMKRIGSGFQPVLLYAGLNLFSLQTVPVSPEYFAGYIEKNYFVNDKNWNHAAFQFNDLNPRRPELVLNATLASEFRSLAEDSNKQRYLRRRNADENFHFAFTDYYFRQIDSQWGPYPLSLGVAVSAAFPVLVGYGTLVDWRRCPDKVSNPDKCRQDKSLTLALTDGGANDNQGLIEILAYLGEIANHEYRSNGSKQLPQRNTMAQIDKFAAGDRGLVVVLNSSITEVTGVDTPEASRNKVFGSIKRALTAVDVYSGVSYTLRRRLYDFDKVWLNRGLAKEFPCANDPGKCTKVATTEIGLITLDRYPAGGLEAARVSDAFGNPRMPKARCLTDTAIPGPDGQWIVDENADTILCRGLAQSTAWDYLKVPGTQKSLGLHSIHPQCLFEESKLVDKGIFDLAKLDKDKAVCLRHAARWAAAMRLEELCAKRASGSFALTDASAIRCGGRDLAPLPSRSGQSGTSLQTLDEGLGECELGKNSREDNKGILDALREVSKSPESKDYLANLSRDVNDSSLTADDIPEVCKMRQQENVASVSQVQ